MERKRLLAIQVLIVFITLWILSACSSLQPSALVSAPKNKQEHLAKPYVILVSIDGYRHDYTDRFQPPHLNAIRAEGVAAESLIPVFPSKTFPNHYSIVTGLYPENHGIVANHFYDFSRPQGKQFYSVPDKSTVTDGSWYRGEPIWVSAEKAGMVSAIYFWPGAEAAIQGVLPSYTLRYDGDTPNSTRVRRVLDWLNMPAEYRPHFIALYFNAVDNAGHAYGPSSPEVRDAVFAVDAAIGELRAGLAKLGFPVNLVVLSDHGMQDLKKEDAEYLDDYTDLSSVTVGDLGPQVLLYGRDSAKLEKIYADLKAKGKHYKIYRRAELPHHFHYSKDPRAGDLVVVAEAPYSIGIRHPRFRIVKGNHGYDPRANKNMHGIFYATGPNFKPSMRFRSFSNVHIYPMLLNVLGLSGPKILDGNTSTLTSILR